MITSAAQKAGFGGGIVVDYPNSKKARKMYLCLMVGQQEVPKGIDGDEMGIEDKERLRETIRNEKRRRKDKVGGGKRKKGKADITAKDWVLKKKDLYRTRGKEGWVVVVLLSYHLADQQRPERFQVHREETTGTVLTAWLWDHTPRRCLSPTRVSRYDYMHAVTTDSTGHYPAGTQTAHLEFEARPNGFCSICSCHLRASSDGSRHIANSWASCVRWRQYTASRSDSIGMADEIIPGRFNVKFRL